MAEEKSKATTKNTVYINKNKWMMKKGGGMGGLWFGGFLGAIIYYLHFHSGTFWLVILAFLKAIVWPVLLVYHLMLFLHM